MKKRILLVLSLVVQGLVYGQCYQQFSYGSYHVTAIKTDGTLWGWGYGAGGQLGNSTWNNPSPIQISSATHWQKVFTGYHTTFVIKNDGTLWGIGASNHGLLGNGSTSGFNSTLQQIGTANNWLKISVSQDMVIGLKTDGTLWGWGMNDTYQMGNGTCCADQLTPIQIGMDTNWIDIETSHLGSAFAQKSDGTIWRWGSNVCYMLAGSGVQSLPVPTLMNADTDWASYSVGDGHGLAIKTNGTLWTWGCNGVGQGGNSSPGAALRYNPSQIGTATWSSACAGSGISFGIQTDGSLWAWGKNDEGQLGLGAVTANQLVPIQVGTDTNWAKLYSDGNATTFGIKTDGTIWVWGDNQAGQYGNGTIDNDFLVPTQLTGMCTTLSAPSFSENSSISLYPNPSKGMVTLDYELETAAQLQVIDVSGRVVLERELVATETSVQFTTTAMASGVYAVQVLGKNGGVWRSKLVLE